MVNVKSSISLFYIAWTQIAQAQDDNEVIIRGHESGRRSVNRAGNSTVIRPSEESQFDTNFQFKLDPSLSALDQSRPNAGGFSLPLFRGNDARASHVFLDDVELQDPFTGLPLLEDIDLRAFGELRIHRGLAPWDVPLAMPGGAIQFVSRPVLDSHGELGGGYGNVYGTSGWGEYQHAGETFDSKTYVRRHSAKGNYSFYSDNGTPQNLDDDSTRQRDNNDRSANLGSTLIRFHGESTDAQVFGWAQEAKQGLPVPLTTGDGNARIDTTTQAISAKIRHELSNRFGFGGSTQQLTTARNFRDPSQNIGRTANREFSTQTTQGSLKLDYASLDDALHWLVQTTRSTARIHLKSSQAEEYNPHADQAKIYTGGLWRASDMIDMEWKADQSTTDLRSSTSFGAKTIGATALVRMDDWSGWIQGAEFTREPSMFERDGNGAEYLGNDGLTHEFGLFYEIGLRKSHTRWNQWSGERSLTFWSEDLHDRIRALPISTTLWKSRNMGLERYRGIEGREKWRLSFLELEGGVSATRATNDRGGLLPLTPLWQGVFGTCWSLLPDWTFRTTSRYQGRTYDDEENTLEIGDTWIHDLALDRYSDDSPWSFGVSILNVSDVRYIPVRDVATGQSDGRIAWQSRQREPLPGRQYMVKVSTKL